MVPRERARIVSRRLAEAGREALLDLLRCLRFYSRLPVPQLPSEPDPHAAPDFATMPRLLPIAGAIIGAVGGAVLVGALALGLGPLLAAALAVTATTLATGAFHEDGLADTADGFGGGTTPERRLEIMRDSRIGAFGGTALVLAFGLRIAAITELAQRLDLAGAFAAFVIVAALSRCAALVLMMRLPPARMSGSSYAVGQPTRRTFVTAWALAAGLALAAAAATGLPLPGLILAFALAVGAALAMARAARRLVGGHTGDVAGATQQLAEITALVGLLIAAPP
ncbi:MAG TPA: adenosylcobinamide-GDP ribazoletransferase [Beijerinckiaceae bacterium]|nr:adenosylcobinamide-GDP ribazoletransferase [Beijerinckiaceae bacterium]